MNMNNSVKKKGKKSKKSGDSVFRMLTVSEVAELLHVHPSTIRKWTNQGMMRAARIGTRGDRRFKREDISAFLNEQGREHYNTDALKKLHVLLMNGVRNRSDN
jgi:excisionase family DNA binding protein